MNHGGHGEGGEHLVRRLDGEDGWAVWRIIRDAHGEAALVDLVELRVGVPGLVEVDARYGFGKFGDDLVDVVAEAIVRGVGDDGVGGVLICDAGSERTLVDDAADELGAETPRGAE